MSWTELMGIIRDEAGEELADRLEARFRRELAGVRLTVCARAKLTADEVDKVAPGDPKKAARKLGVHFTTVYRALNRDRIIR